MHDAKNNLNNLNCIVQYCIAGKAAVAVAVLLLLLFLILLQTRRAWVSCCARPHERSWMT
jgi:hypothetical protein